MIDRIVEERCGANIPWIFDVEGEEPGCRSCHADELSGEDKTVLATGGMPWPVENHELLRRDALVIHLKTSIEQQVERTRKDRKRPLLQNDDQEAVLRKLFRERDPLYTKLADIVMFTDRRVPVWWCVSWLTGLTRKRPVINGSDEKKVGRMQKIYHELRVDLGERSYPIVIGRGLMGGCDLIMWPSRS